MKKVKVCGPRGLQQAVMKKAWKEAKQKEAKGEYVDIGKLMSKHRRKIGRELKKAKACIEVTV